MPKHASPKRKFRDPAREFLLLIGAPSNMFNGWGFKSDGQWAPNSPPDLSVAYKPAEVTKYLHDRKSHDVYWANFLYAAVKLVETRRISPDPGDIVTFLLFMPPYRARQTVDWDASPYNPRNLNSRVVKGKFPYNPEDGAAQQAFFDDLNTCWDGPGLAQADAPYDPASEAEFNHYILMQVSGEYRINNNQIVRDSAGRPLFLFNGGFPRQLRYSTEITTKILNVPHRVANGSCGPPLCVQGEAPLDIPPLPSVLVKLLLADTKDEILRYIKTGDWSGRRHCHATDVPLLGEDEGDNSNPVNWDYDVLQSEKIPAEWTYAPGLRREVVKIQRLDYFGHSTDALFLKYGWNNRKGDPNAPSSPAGCIIEVDEVASLDSGQFAPGAETRLWGCNLAGSFAQTLSTCSQGNCRAVEGKVEYDPILFDHTSMPKLSTDAVIHTYENGQDVGMEFGGEL